MVSPAGRLRVLLVEDSVDDAELIALELRRNGYELTTLRVDERESTRAALERDRWDLVLSDHAMPSFSAAGVVQLLGEIDPDIPCIVVSGAIGEEAAVALLKSGAVDYVNKSKLYQLGPAVSRALREAEDRRARHTAEQALRESETRFRLIAENARDLISMTTMAGDYVYISPSHLTVLGFQAEQLRGRRLLDLVHPDHRQALEGWPETEHFELRMRCADERWLWVEGSTSVVTWQGRPHVVTIARDISAQKEMTERLKQLAYYDPLTGLPNRTLLRDRLQQALAHAHRSGEHVGVMFLDFDNFKILNDSLGHEFGDHVLKAVARRISSSIRAEDTVARLGGDEFVVVLHGLRQAQDAARVATKVLDHVSQPLEIEGQEVRLTTSIGIAVSDGLEGTIEDLLKHADLAMYRAKERGKGTYQFFTPTMDAQAMERLNLEREMRRALERREFVLYYQPRVDLRTLTVTSLEALVRWQHPSRGLLLPHAFIPLAEETGMIRALGDLVLSEACRQARVWQDAGFALQRVAVNLSVKQLFVSSFADSVKSVLDDSGLAPEHLELEITESATIGYREDTIATLDTLKDLGVYLSLDDFGTGYSSLAYLKRLPLDSLKIDRHFVHDLTFGDSESQDAAIIRAVVALGKNLDLALVGEGIETELQLRFLSEVGFDEGQGFLFSEPLPPDAVAELFTRAKLGGPVASPRRQQLESP